MANVSAFSAMKVLLTRLGHANKLVVNRILSTFHLDHSKDRNKSIYQACMQAKIHRQPLYSIGSISNKPFDVIFSDVWTSPIMSPAGYKYFVSFIDDYSRFI